MDTVCGNTENNLSNKQSVKGTSETKTTGTQGWKDDVPDVQEYTHLHIYLQYSFWHVSLLMYLLRHKLIPVHRDGKTMFLMTTLVT